MKEGGVGGGNTRTGLNFEVERDLLTALAKAPGYTVKDSTILYVGVEVARSYRKHSFYKMLSLRGVDYRQHLSKKLLPDDALFVIVNNTLFIIEMKFQKVSGSVDEKLQTCDFKRKQYLKLVVDLGLKVEYVYVLSDWFKDPRYRDVLDYINSVNCHYKFGSLPLAWLGLPTE